MADFISLQSSEEFIKSTTLNLSNKDLLTETEQSFEKNASSVHSKNKDSKSRDGGAGDSEISAVPKTSKSNQKNIICMSAVLRLSTPRNYNLNVALKDMTQVKISALLYEITDRTNRLAQPRSRVAEIKASQKPLKSRIPKSTLRICELACPKVIRDSPPKPVNFVSPNALKAIATQRIIELSRPRKDRSFQLPRHKTEIFRSCNLSIRGLPKMKQVDRLRNGAKPFESSMRNKSELLQESLCSTLDNGRHAKSRRKNLKQINKLEVSKIKQKSSSRYFNDTNSNRSVVIVDLYRKSDPG
ncbi:uncharacterized protein [Linepithema humile]|uniref:uncharacterized protein isoform X1 n=1 Tax=Linepithema humile TaxID=83485 RepID=UPI00351DABC4